MIVIKLGGSSQTPEGYLNLLSKINGKTVIVVSAIKNVTSSLLDFTRNKNVKLIDTIININKSLIFNLNLNISFFEKDINYLYTMMYKQLDLQDKINLVASGETFTAKILNQFLNTNNIKSEYLDTTEFINYDEKKILLDILLLAFRAAKSDKKKNDELVNFMIDEFLKEKKTLVDIEKVMKNKGYVLDDIVQVGN